MGTEYLRNGEGDQNRKFYLHFNRSPAEQPEEERQNKADEQTGHERKMETEVSPRIADISRKLTEPAPSDTTPEQDSNSGDQQTHNHQDFSHFRHAIL